LQKRSDKECQTKHSRRRERLTHQVTKINQDNRRACAQEMNPSKTSEHKDAN